MLPVTALTKDQVDHCPIRQVLSHCTGKWHMLIILTLEDGGLRFGVLKRTVGDITQRVLTENLRRLERDGHINRDVNPGPPVAVTYSLTPQGRALLDHVKALVIWAAQTHPHVIESRQSFDADT
ncbi:MAG: helix-turn-helix domain-containing protein [Pseudomonadota bacterium]